MRGTDLVGGKGQGSGGTPPATAARAPLGCLRDPPCTPDPREPELQMLQRAQWAPDPVESPQPVHVVHPRAAPPGASGSYLSPWSPRPGSADSWPGPTRGLPGAMPSKTERQRVGISLGNEAVPPRAQTHARSPLPGSPASAARGRAPSPDQSRQKALLPGSPRPPGQPWPCAPNPRCCPATPLRLCCSAVLSAPPRLPHRVLGSALLC